METMKFKNMLYGKRKEGEILAEGEVGIYRFKVVSYGSHPCCYVHVPIVHPLYENLDLAESIIDCHGGITFDGSLTKFGDEQYYIGWDYAHAGDYMSFGDDIPYHNEEDKKYSILELVADCYYVIGQLQMYEQIKSQSEYKNFLGDLDS